VSINLGLNRMRMMENSTQKLDPRQKLKPIIHWRNPMLGKFYYLKGLRRKKTENKQQKEWPKKIPLHEENPVFKASRIIPRRTKYYNASEVIPTKTNLQKFGIQRL
jgi:hypothetical protein